MKRPTKRFLSGFFVLGILILILISQKVLHPDLNLRKPFLNGASPKHKSLEVSKQGEPKVSQESTKASYDLLEQAQKNGLSWDVIRTFLQDPNREEERVSFLQGSGKFTSLPGIVAVLPRDLTETEKAQEIGQFLGFSLVPKEKLENPDKSYPIVVETQRGTLALVSGNLKIEHEDSVNLRRLENSFGLKLIQTFPAIHLSLFSANQQPLKEMIQIVEASREVPGVNQVTLDLIETVRVSN